MALANDTYDGLLTWVNGEIDPLDEKQKVLTLDIHADGDYCVTWDGFHKCEREVWKGKSLRTALAEFSNQLPSDA